MTRLKLHKICPVCKVDKLRSEYWSDRGKIYGYCAVCARAKKRDYRELRRLASLGPQWWKRWACAPGMFCPVHTVDEMDCTWWCGPQRVPVEVAAAAASRELTCYWPVWRAHARWVAREVAAAART